MSEILTSPPVESAAETPVNTDSPDLEKLPNLHARAFDVGLGGKLKLRWFQLRKKHAYRTAETMLNNEFAPQVIEAENLGKTGQAAAIELRRQKLQALTEEIPVDRTSTIRQVAQWVGNHLDVAAEKILPDAIPSRYALAMLEMAGESRESREDFIYNKYPAMVKGKEEGASGASDSGGDDDDPSRTIIDDLLAQARTSAAGADRESGVSQDAA